MYKTIITSILFISLSFFVLASCAGSREESEDFLSEDEKQQKELDDIEALLGIAPNKDQQPAKKAEEASTSEEKLNLLDTNEIIDSTQPAATPTASIQEMQAKISNLENQLSQKERAIDYLNEQLTLKDQELNKRPTVPGGKLTAVNDVSMEEYQSRYDDARAEFENRNYESAAQLFESMLSASSSHSLSDNAQYWIGECHYALKQYDKAIIDFEKVFTFAKSNKDDDAQYKLGLCYLRKGDKVKAREEFDRLIRSFPNSEYAQKAENLLTQN